MVRSCSTGNAQFVHVRYPAAQGNISPTVGTLPEPLDIPFNAIALDGTEVPTTIYVGTDLGVLRSVDTGVSWSILDDIHFPRVPVTDLVLNQTAGVLVAGTYGRGVFKFTTPVGPSIAVQLQDGLNFGTVCSGTYYLTLDVYNVGGADLTITSVQRLMGSADFSVLATPATPLTVQPGEDVVQGRTADPEQQRAVHADGDRYLFFVRRVRRPGGPVLPADGRAG